MPGTASAVPQHAVSWYDMMKPEPRFGVLQHDRRLQRALAHGVHTCMVETHVSKNAEAKQQLLLLAT